MVTGTAWCTFTKRPCAPVHYAGAYPLDSLVQFHITTGRIVKVAPAFAALLCTTIDGGRASAGVGAAAWHSQKHMIGREFVTSTAVMADAFTRHPGTISQEPPQGYRNRGMVPGDRARVGAKWKCESLKHDALVLGEGTPAYYSYEVYGVWLCRSCFLHAVHRSGDERLHPSKRMITPALLQETMKPGSFAPFVKMFTSARRHDCVAQMDPLHWAGFTNDVARDQHANFIVEAWPYFTNIWSIRAAACALLNGYHIMGAIQRYRLSTTCSLYKDHASSMCKGWMVVGIRTRGQNKRWMWNPHPQATNPDCVVASIEESPTQTPVIGPQIGLVVATLSPKRHQQLSVVMDMDYVYVMRALADCVLQIALEFGPPIHPELMVPPIAKKHIKRSCMDRCTYTGERGTTISPYYFNGECTTWSKLAVMLRKWTLAHQRINANASAWTMPPLVLTLVGSITRAACGVPFSFSRANPLVVGSTFLELAHMALAKNGTNTTLPSYDPSVPSWRFSKWSEPLKYDDECVPGVPPVLAAERRLLSHGANVLTDVVNKLQLVGSEYATTPQEYGYELDHTYMGDLTRAEVLEKLRTFINHVELIPFNAHTAAGVDSYTTNLAKQARKNPLQQPKRRSQPQSRGIAKRRKSAATETND
jgi:hypothetical protein